jgi:hypothetical protein
MGMGLSLLFEAPAENGQRGYIKGRTVTRQYINGLGVCIQHGAPAGFHRPPGGNDNIDQHRTQKKRQPTRSLTLY